MFGISLPELLVVAVIALLVLGPDKLPQMAAQLGKLSFQLKKTSDSFRREFYNSVYKPSEEQNINLTTELKSFKQQILELPAVSSDSASPVNTPVEEAKKQD